MNRLWILWNATFLLTISGVAQATSEAPRPQDGETDKPVEIAAFGDSAWIGELATVHSPQSAWIKRRLKGVSSLMAPDVNMLNLEASLTRTCDEFSGKTWQFAVNPATAAVFAEAGFNAFALANNHSLDCIDPPASREIEPSLKMIRAVAPGTVFHGVATRSADLLRPAIMEIRGIRLGMVSIKGWSSGARQNVGNLSNRAEIFAALRDADVDVRILNLHGGTESERKPTVEMIRVAREFVALYRGDLVFGHHPHVSQGLEVLRRQDGRTAAIFYSLGNFLHDGLSRRGDGMVARVSVNREGLIPSSVRIFPLAAASWRPAPLAPQNLMKALRPIQDSMSWLASTLLRADLARTPLKIETFTTPHPGMAVVPGP